MEKGSIIELNFPTDWFCLLEKETGEIILYMLEAAGNCQNIFMRSHVLLFEEGAR